MIFFDHIAKFFDLHEITKPSVVIWYCFCHLWFFVINWSWQDNNECNFNTLIYVESGFNHQIKAGRTALFREAQNYSQIAKPSWINVTTILLLTYLLVQGRGLNLKTSKTSLNSSKSKQSADRCLFCKCSQHMISNCTSFTAEPIAKRFQSIKSVPVCINWLKKDNTVARCPYSKCQICNGSHNTLFHRYKFQQRINKLL